MLIRRRKCKPTDEKVPLLHESQSEMKESNSWVFHPTKFTKIGLVMFVFITILRQLPKSWDGVQISTIYLIAHFFEEITPLNTNIKTIPQVNINQMTKEQVNNLIVQAQLPIVLTGWENTDCEFW